MSNELLAKVIEAHGGLERWNGYQKVEAAMVVGGGFIRLKGFPTSPDAGRVTNWLHEEKSSAAPFGAPDQRSMFTIGRIAIEKLDGTVVAERRAPRDSFAGHQMNTPWDALHLAYFSGEAAWTYFTTPFLLAMKGVDVQETDAWQEGSETWRVLRAFFPGQVETHSIEQDFFFGPDFMLRRHDFNVNVAGGFGASQLIADYVVAGGIRVPTRRRIHVRSADRHPIPDMLMVSLDISDVTFS